MEMLGKQRLLAGLPAGSSLHVQQHSKVQAERCTGQQESLTETQHCHLKNQAMHKQTQKAKRPQRETHVQAKTYERKKASHKGKNPDKWDEAPSETQQVLS